MKIRNARRISSLRPSSYSVKAIAIRDDAPRERVPMISRRQDVKKRRTSAGASSVCCAN